MPQKIKALSTEFDLVGEGGVDERKRVSLAKALGLLNEKLLELGASIDAIHFRVSVNSAGQILLDPALPVPVNELWLYRNRTALAKVREGLADAKRGKVRNPGSFAKYANDEIE